MLPRQYDSHQLGENIVNRAKKRAHRKHHRDDDQREINRLIARRPNDLAKFRRRLAPKPPNAILRRDFLSRPRHFSPFGTRLRLGSLLCSLESHRLFGLAMHRVRAAEATILFQLEPRRRVLFVLLGCVIAPLAFVARERDRQPIFFLCHG